MAELDKDNEVLLLLQLEQGNTRAFDALYEKYWEQAYSDAYRRIKDEAHAKDVVQEIFISIWMNRESRIDNFPAYIHTAVRNRVFRLIEKEKSIYPFFSVLEDLPATSMQADAGIRWTEFQRAYEDLLTTLPPKRQTIFRMRFQEELTTKAIADQLDLSRKTVQNQLGKAIEQLRVSFMHLFALIAVLFLY